LGRRSINGGALGVETTHIVTPPALITIDLHLCCVGLSRKFYLGCCYSGSRIAIELTGDVGASQNTLWSTVLEKGANVDRHHHSPLSHFWLFDGETLKKTRQGRGEIVELNICEKHVVK
jgi:hypothetical protein